jgi:hypothetical protein
MGGGWRTRRREIKGLFCLSFDCWVSFWMDEYGGSARIRIGKKEKQIG